MTKRQLRKLIREEIYKLNENDSNYAKEIASLTGLSSRAVEKFIKTNNIDGLELTMAVGQNKPKGIRKDVMAAIVGKPNNKYFKDIVSTYSK